MPLIDSLLPLAQSDIVRRPFGTRELIDQLARTQLSWVVGIAVVLTVLRILVHPTLTKTAVHLRGTKYAGLKILNEVFDAFIYAGIFVFMLIRPFGVQAFLIPSGSMWPTLYINDFIVANKAIYRTRDPLPGEIVVFRPPVAAVQDHPEQYNAKTGEISVDFIKRCIGVPGQVIELHKGVLYRDGKPVGEPYKTYSACTERISSDCANFRVLSDAERDSLALADFKLVNYKGRLIPLNYTSDDANSSSPMGGAYSISKEYENNDPAESRKMMDLPAQPIPPGYFLMMGDNRNGSYDGRAWGLVPRKDIIGRSELIWLPPPRWRLTR